jgi:hypothetical protein
MAVVQHTFTHKHAENAENGTYIAIKTFYRRILEVQAVPRLCELYPGICLTTEE